MTPIEILEQAKAAGISIDVHEDRLVLDMPTGALTAELRSELARHKAALVAALAPARAFVTFRGGLTVPLPAWLLALDLERRGFRLSLDAEQQIVIERTEETADLTELSDIDQLLIDRWRLHLGALVAYDVHREERPQ